MDAGSPRCGLWKKVEICSIFTCFFRIRTATLDSGIDVGQAGKKNKRRDRKFGKKKDIGPENFAQKNICRDLTEQLG